MVSRFAWLDAKEGRPSIAPERLLRALLLRIFYSVRSERLLNRDRSGLLSAGTEDGPALPLSLG